MKRSGASIGMILLMGLLPNGQPAQGGVPPATSGVGARSPEAAPGEAGRLVDLSASPGPADGRQGGRGRGEAADPAVRLSSSAPSQGDPLLVRVTPEAPADAVTVRWRGHAYPMRKEPDGSFLALLGVDLLAPPGNDTVWIEARRGGTVVSRTDLRVEIRERDFPVQELTLPRGMTEFDPETLARIHRESSALADRFSRISSPVLWSLPFLPPVADFRPGPFGSRRVINGEPRSPHAGIDLTLPEGTPVLAISDGIVAFSGEQFFGGRSVILDHGGGLFSVYYHLKEAAVSEGRRVARGERIGSVGMSGRATGPHLHFSVRAAGGRVDPTLLFPLSPR